MTTYPFNVATLESDTDAMLETETSWVQGTVQPGVYEVIDFDVTERGAALIIALDRHPDGPVASIDPSDTKEQADIDAETERQLAAIEAADQPDPDDWYERTFGLTAPAPVNNVLDPDLGDPDRCEFCGERFTPSSEVGEFGDPSESPSDEPQGHKIGHAECGLNAGWFIA